MIHYFQIVLMHYKAEHIQIAQTAALSPSHLYRLHQTHYQKTSMEHTLASTYELSLHFAKEHHNSPYKDG